MYSTPYKEFTILSRIATPDIKPVANNSSFTMTKLSDQETHIRYQIDFKQIEQNCYSAIQQTKSNFNFSQ